MSPPPSEPRRHEQRDGPPVPAGRAVGGLSPEQCLELLRAHGVELQEVAAADAAGVEGPIQLLGSLAGVEVLHRGRSDRHSVMDCRLALSLLAWAPALARAGIVRVEHYSIYRPGARVRGTRQPSGHASGLAVDAARFHLEDGTVLDVETTWQDRRRGIAPCAPPEEGPEEEPEDQALLRALVCEAVRRDLFQVVLTPHHDHAHRNHLHLELRPGVDWSHVR